MNLKAKDTWRMQMEMKNSEVIKNSLEALNNIAARRTSTHFAEKVMETLMKTLKDRFQFLQYVQFKDENNQCLVNVSVDIDSFDSAYVFKAIETAIRIIHMDLQDKGGLYFIKEFKEFAGIDTIKTLEDYGVDLSILSMEQKHAYLQKKEKENIVGDASVLGYSWSDVSNWKYDDHNNVCILYNNEEGILDKLNLDAIIQEHIERITGIDDVENFDGEFQVQTERYQKEFDLLQLLKSKDVDIDTVLSILQINEDDLEHMIKRLMNLGFLEYVDVDVVKITEKGMQYISKPVH